MKKEFESKLLQAIIETKGCRSIMDPETLSWVLSEVTQELCLTITIPSPYQSYKKVLVDPSPSEIQEMTDLHQRIIQEYDLEVGQKWLTFKMGTYGEEEYLVYGKGFIGFINYRKLQQGVTFPELTNIVYSGSALQVVKKICGEYQELCQKISEKYKEKNEKVYEVTIVVMEEGRYEPIKTGIFPTVSLTSPGFMENYNQDFPESKIKNFLDIDKGGIMIFNGQPGCGKSTYLRSLIFRYPDINFVILPQYLLLNQEALRQFLFKMVYGEKDCVYIVEDCEQLLVQRENNPAFSSVIGDILNYTDGIFGDLTRTKFIFTFNTDLKNVDKALLRPGRLYLRYEFTPLRGENLEKMASRLGYTLSEEEKKSGIPLSELYYKTKTEDLTVGIRPSKRVGFDFKYTTDGVKVGG